MYLKTNEENIIEKIKIKKRNTIIKIFQFDENKLEFNLVKEINNPHIKVIKETKN